MLRRGWHVLKNGQWLCCTRRLKLHTSTFPVLYARFDKDLPQPHMPTPISKAYGPDTDILLEQLRKCRNINRVLELIDMHLNVMNSKHVVTCFESIHNFAKDDIAMANSLLENISFQSLCSRLMKVIRLFDPQEVISTYKVLCEIKIASNTYVMQCVLKMLGAHMNNMTLGQLTFLNFLLHKQRHNSLVDGLKLALPLVLQVQIDQQLDSDNITEVVKCLQISCRARLKTATLEKVMNAVIQKASMLSVDNSITIVFSLLNLETPVDGYKELINAAFEIMSRNIEDMSEKNILSVLGACKNQSFYHSLFFFAVADHIVANKWNLESTYSVVSNFSRLEFAPSNLLDHFAEVLCSEYEQFKNNNMYSPLTCIEYLTATSYRPIFVDEAARLLYSDENKLEQWLTKSPHLLIKFLSCIAFLGHFPQNYLSKAVDEDFLYEAFSSSRKQGRSQEFERNVFSLSWGFEVYDEQKNFSIPASLQHKFMNAVHQKHTSIEYPLAKFIENGLGGPQFLQSGVFTLNGHVIDHIVAMRSGNYPVSLDNVKSKGIVDKTIQHIPFVEDYILPEDAKIIAILIANKVDFCRDPEVIKGYMDIKVRSLAKKNFSVVVVNYNLWRNLPDREKIPFLMREIKQAVQDDCILKTNYS